jgi:sulfate transport system permease protein
MSTLAASPSLMIRRIHGRSATAAWVKGGCIAITLGFIGLFLLLPLVSVFYEAFRGGWSNYVDALKDPDSLRSMKMTLLVAAFAVPLNTVFGVAAAWSIAKFQFKGKALLTTLIDIPFAVSPVISGLIFVVLFGQTGLFGPWMIAHNIPIVFHLPGMVLATTFVTFPFVARELIPLMQEQGSQEEQAAISLGASGWQTFWKITLPNIKWGLLYGVLLCNARAMGEFGAVNVLTQNSPDTNTVPLQIQNMYDGFQIPGAFALSTVLAFLGLVTLVAKSLLEWKVRRDRNANTSE